MIPEPVECPQQVARLLELTGSHCIMDQTLWAPPAIEVSHRIMS